MQPVLDHWLLPATLTKSVNAFIRLLLGFLTTALLQNFRCHRNIQISGRGFRWTGEPSLSLQVLPFYWEQV